MDDNQMVNYPPLKTRGKVKCAIDVVIVVVSLAVVAAIAPRLVDRADRALVESGIECKEVPAKQTP